MTCKDLLAPGMGLWLASVPFLTHIQGNTPDINFCRISQYVTVRHLLWRTYIYLFIYSQRRILNFLYISMRTSQEVFNSESGITYGIEGMKLLGSSNSNDNQMPFLLVFLLCLIRLISWKLKFMFEMLSSQNWQSAAGVKICLSYGLWRLLLRLTSLLTA